MPRQECYAGGFAGVTWDILLMSRWRGRALMYNKAMDLDGVVSRLWSIPTTWRAEASCRDLWVETCMLAEMLVGDDSWSS